MAAGSPCHFNTTVKEFESLSKTAESESSRISFLTFSSAFARQTVPQLDNMAGWASVWQLCDIWLSCTADVSRWKAKAKAMAPDSPSVCPSRSATAAKRLESRNRLFKKNRQIQQSNGNL